MLLADIVVTTEYDTIKILRPTRRQLDDLKRSMGFPSYSQVITTLVERQKTKEDVVEQLSKDLAEESSKVFIQLLYQFMFSIASQIPKPLAEITLAEIFKVIQSHPTKINT